MNQMNVVIITVLLFLVIAALSWIQVKARSKKKQQPEASQYVVPEYVQPDADQLDVGDLYPEESAKTPTKSPPLPAQSSLTHERKSTWDEVLDRARPPTKPKSK